MAVSREHETRAAKQRKTTWQPASLLPVPDQEDGMTYRYIRVGSLGSPDNRNLSKRLREGWVAVSAKDHPELSIISDKGAEADTIEIGGLLLCKMPNENVRARDAFYAKRAKDQMTAVENDFLRDNDPRMRKSVETRSRTSFGTGGE